MTLFRSFQKSAFWSPLLLGVLAILSFSEQTFTVQENDTTIVNQQAFYFGYDDQKSDLEQAAFFFFMPECSSKFPQQAVEFCEFFAKPYRLLSLSPPPIRAGPIFLV